MHHKRKGPKSIRAGCLLCKPHKRQGTPMKQRLRFSDLRKARIGGRRDLRNRQFAQESEA